VDFLYRFNHIAYRFNHIAAGYVKPTPYAYVKFSLIS